MLHDLIASTAGGETILDWIEWAALAIEIIAVAIIVGAIVYAISHYLFHQSSIPKRKVNTNSSKSAWEKPCCWVWRSW